MAALGRRLFLFVVAKLIPGLGARVPHQTTNSENPRKNVSCAPVRGVLPGLAFRAIFLE